MAEAVVVLVVLEDVEAEEVEALLVSERGGKGTVLCTRLELVGTVLDATVLDTTVLDAAVLDAAVIDEADPDEGMLDAADVALDKDAEEVSDVVLLDTGVELGRDDDCVVEVELDIVESLVDGLSSGNVMIIWSVDVHGTYCVVNDCVVHAVLVENVVDVPGIEDVHTDPVVVGFSSGNVITHWSVLVHSS